MEQKNTSTIWPVQAPCQIAYQDPVSGYFWLRPYVDLQRKSKIWGIAIDGIVFRLVHEVNGDWNTAITLKHEKSRAQMATTTELDIAFAYKDAFNDVVALLKKLDINAEAWYNGWYWSNENQGDEAVVVDMTDCHPELVPKRYRNGYVRLVSHYVVKKPITVGYNLVYLHEGKFKLATDFRPYLSPYLWGLDGGKYYLHLNEEPQRLTLGAGLARAAGLCTENLKIDLPSKEELEKVIKEKNALNNALVILSAYGVNVDLVNNREPHWLTKNLYHKNGFDGFVTYFNRLVRADEPCICRLVGRSKGKIEFM